MPSIEAENLRISHQLVDPDESLAGAWRRRAYFGPETGWCDTPVLRRADLTAPRDGPCIIEEYDATCVVPLDARATLDPFGNVVIELHLELSCCGGRGSELL